MRDGGAQGRKASSGTALAGRVPPSSPPVSARGNWKNLRLLGLAKQSYLVCEGEEGVYVLDQHAAHERSILAELRRAFAQGRVPSQAMLFPETIELSPVQHARAECHAPFLERLGLELRLRSEHSASIHSAPRLLTRVKADVLLKQLLEDLPDGEVPDNYDGVLAHLACTEAVKPGERLLRETAESFLRSLASADFDVACPHGRVILSVTSLGDLQRKAGRS